jgi:hypothetical protein
MITNILEEGKVIGFCLGDRDVMLIRNIGNHIPDTAMP